MLTSRISAAYHRGSSHLTAWESYSRLHPLSLAISTVRMSGVGYPSVIVVLPEVHPARIFAGIRTALEFACGLASEMSLSLKVVAIGAKLGSKDKILVEDYIRKEFEFHGLVTAIGAADVSELGVCTQDIWLATHWTTAHSLDVAALLGVVNRDRVVYLIQDYEPGFHAWSTDYALARSTYHANFLSIVNSSPLQRFLAETEDLAVDDSMVFAPSLDITRAKLAAETRQSANAIRIMFYARPSKPRNLFGIGIAALGLSAAGLAARGIEVTFCSAGEPHDEVHLTPEHTLTSLGKLNWDEYFKLLGQTDIVLSLQLSPHPSHPPLDAIASGTYAVTNELGGTRAGLHRRLLVAEPEPQALAAQIMRAVDSVRARETDSHPPESLRSLGNPIRAVYLQTATVLSRPILPKIQRS